MSPTDPRVVVAMGGGGFSEHGAGDPLDRLVLELARAGAALRGRDCARPRVCFVPTAGGDSDVYIAKFLAAFEDVAEPGVLRLFDRSVVDVEGFLRDQDAVYVGGGNTVNMLAIWGLHGVDRALRRAWSEGVVMAGVSAGSLCWFEAGTTDAYGPELAILDRALGFLPGSHCPHYDVEPGRRPLYQRLVADGRLPAGYAADDDAALVFRGTGLAESVSARPGAGCYRVERRPDGSAGETALPTRPLPGS